MSDSTRSLLTNVITFDDHRIKNHLDHVVPGSVEKTLNALLDAEADRAIPSATTQRSPSRYPSRPRSVPKLVLELGDILAVTWE